MEHALEYKSRKKIAHATCQTVPDGCILYSACSLPQQSGRIKAAVLAQNAPIALISTVCGSPGSCAKHGASLKQSQEQ